MLSFPATAAAKARTIVATMDNQRVKFSLGTSDPVSVVIRQGLALAHVETLFAALHTGPSALTHKQTCALAGDVYRLFIDKHSDDPAPPEVWQALKGFSRAIREGRIVAGTVPPLTAALATSDLGI